MTLVHSMGIAHVLLLPLAGAPVAPGHCLQYEPAVVQLEGTIRRHTFAGPPGYESVAAGDRPETMWILTVAQPVCVDGIDDIDIAESGVKRIQLVLDQKQYRQYRHLVGHAVRAEGALFHQITGHHFETLLLKVRTLDRRPAKRVH